MWAASYGDLMDTEMEGGRAFPGAVMAGPVPPADQVERWLAERLAQRQEFLRRCIAWGAVGTRMGALVWPQDEMEILALGVPCDDCVTVVTALGTHTLTVVMVGGRLHWSDGIVARCGKAPAWAS